MFTVDDETTAWNPGRLRVSRWRWALRHLEEWRELGPRTSISMLDVPWENVTAFSVPTHPSELR